MTHSNPFQPQNSLGSRPWPGQVAAQSVFISILATAALHSKPSKLKSTVLAAAFLLKANVTDQASNIFAEAIASKALANDAQRAESTLALKFMSETLAGVSSSLDAMALMHSYAA
ncbi:hypothetical protein E4T56_gene4486 [Termitomyces sp. T112]|nr:hypothetical protein E4T56_gene4486 [Termitomyces sp. T112]